MTEQHEDLLFDLTLTDEQRMNRETMQRFAAAEIRDQAKIADEAIAPRMTSTPRPQSWDWPCCPYPRPWAAPAWTAHRSPTP